MTELPTTATVVTCATHPEHGSHYARTQCASPVPVTAETLAAERAVYVAAMARAHLKMFPPKPPLTPAEAEAEDAAMRMHTRLARRRELSEVATQFATFKNWRNDDRFYETPLRVEYTALSAAFEAVMTRLEELTRA